MTLPSAQKLYAIIDGTWPSSAKQALGPWTVRLDDSGSSRVSAATAEGPATDHEIDLAAAAMMEAGQNPLFMIREGDEWLDAKLEEQGYVIKDPVNMYAAPIDLFATDPVPPVTAFRVWPPLTIQTEIWEAGGIGAGRIAIMDRARPPKTTLLGRMNDKPAGTVYIGMAADCVMIHALEVGEGHRRQGLAKHLTRAAAFWGKEQGAAFLTLVAAQNNEPANTLYASLGMTVVGQYHYRSLPE
ncbi:GNAT family N-acetyltransferase [Yoonia sp. SDW83-1]|uniref:GNAT family N-acetyltransferase n=1 Tax=Yoonia sp. SDW83-1 TaxID=3366945 RepID=UPI00398C4158